MADFVAVLKKTLDGLSDTTPLMREKVYEKARITISSKLATMNPPLPDAVIEKQKQALEEAIVKVEEEYARKPVDPLAELENVFASLKNPDTRAVLRPPVARPAPVEKPPAPTPAPASPVARVVESPAPAAPVQQPAPAARPPIAERTTLAAPAPVEKAPPVARPPAVKPAVVAESRPAPRQEPAAPKAPSLPAKDWFRPIDEPDEQRPIAARPPEEVAEAFYPTDPGEREEIAGEDEPVRRRRYGWLVAAVALIAVVAGSAYGAWLKQDEVRQLLTRAGIPGFDATTGGAPSPEPAAPTVAPQSDVAAVEPAEPVAPAAPAPEAPEPASTGPQKFTQRLNPDGTETDPGSAGGAPMIGEGTSIAAVTQPSVPEAPAAGPAAPETPAEPPAEASPTPDVAAIAPPDVPPAADQPAATDQPAPPVPEGASSETRMEPAAPPAEADQQPPADTAEQPPADTAQPPAAEAAQQTPPPETPAEPPSEAPAPPPANAAAEPTTPSEVPDAATRTAEVAPAEAAPAIEQTIPVSQKAIFYEERTNIAEASAEPGSIVWSLVQESPGGDLPPEPAIRAEATIPGKDVQLRMTIRRNADQSLPASHIVEMIFLTPEGFEGGGIDSVLRLSLKGSEQEAGSPLLGIPAKIGDGFFLIALNDTKPEIEANTALLRTKSWIDVPVQYKSGRRALFTMEKGIPGTKVFDEALKAWQAATSG